MGRNIDFPPLAIKKKWLRCLLKKNALLLHLYCHNCEQQQKPKAYQGKGVDNEKKRRKKREDFLGVEFEEISLEMWNEKETHIKVFHIQKPCLSLAIYTHVHTHIHK